MFWKYFMAILSAVKTLILPYWFLSQNIWPHIHKLAISPIYGRFGFYDIVLSNFMLFAEVLPSFWQFSHYLCLFNRVFRLKLYSVPWFLARLASIYHTNFFFTCIIYQITQKWIQDKFMTPNCNFLYYVRSSYSPCSVYKKINQFVNMIWS